MIRKNSLKQLCEFVTKRQALAEKIYELLTQDQDIRAHEEKELFLDYNYYTVMSKELQRNLGVEIEDSEEEKVASKIWRERKYNKKFRGEWRNI